MSQSRALPRRSALPGHALPGFALPGFALPAALCAAACLLATSLGGQPPVADTSGSYSEATQVRLVEVPVQVTRAGTPVRGLTAADFAVYAGKQPQRIIGFEVVDLQAIVAAPSAALPSSVTALPVAGRRHFLFLFDLSHSDPRSLQRAQEAALQIAGSSLHAADLAAVAVYSPARGARVLLGFTSDRQQVELAITTLGSTELLERKPDYLGLMLGQATDALARWANVPAKRETPSGEERPRPTEELARKMLDEMRLLESMAERDLDSARRDRVRRFTNSLQDLATLMQQVQGRKHVVFLSRGFDSALLTGEEKPIARQIESAEEELKEITRTDSDRRWGNTRLQGELRRSLEQMRQADCVVHAIDISGAEVEVRAISGEAGAVAAAAPTVGRGAESLFVMADETGGTFHRNYNDVSAAMEQVLESTAVTYVITIQPERVTAKDGYVPLRVELPGQRGVEVSYRTGYYEAPPPGTEGALQERMRIAAELMEGEGGVVPASLLALPAPWGAPGAQAMIFVDGPALLGGHEGDAISAEVTLYAFDPQGAIRGHSRQLVGMDLRSVGDRLRTHGLRLFADLDLPTGSYDLRALVRNTLTGRYGIATARVAVPPEASEAGVTAAFVEPPPAGWLLVREASAGGAPPPYPFTVGERMFAPVARPLPRGGLATLWIELWPEGAEALAGTVRRADGTAVGQAALELGDREPASGGERLLASFTPPPGLSPGGYLLEITLPSAAGGTTTTQVPFTIE